MRVVLDTNAIVSAIITSGVSRELFDAWRLHRRYELVTCPMLLDELDNVLARPRLRTTITSKEREAFLSLLRTESEHVGDPATIPIATRDPHDDYLVALAVREQVTLLVSGDHDLTSLDHLPFRIVTPAQALTLIP